MTQAQKIIINNLISVLLGVIGSMLGSFLHGHLSGNAQNEQSFLITTILFALLVVAFIFVFRYETEAEVLHRLKMDEIKLEQILSATKKEKEVARLKMDKALHDETARAINEGDYKKVKSLQEIRGEE